MWLLEKLNNRGGEYYIFIEYRGVKRYIVCFICFFKFGVGEDI